MGVVFSLFAWSSAPSFAANIINEANKKAVNHVVWYKQAEISPDEVIDKQIPNNATSLIFIRRMDNDPEQSSANVSVNDRFQVSLQPGSYTQVFSCAGINQLSAEQTGLKTNDLLKDAVKYNLPADAVYFFYVDIEGLGNSSVQRITEESARKILATKKYQTHQISRVVPKNCLPAPPQPKPVPQPAPPPILKEKVSIDLEVLFDTDKAIIKPEFVNEVAQVAEFMTAYPGTVAVIEGHTDSRAPDAYNQQLSQRRVDAVVSMLIEQYGIASERVVGIGYGESRPRASNETEEGMRLNRRVIANIEEVIIKQGDVIISYDESVLNEAMTGEAMTDEAMTNEAMINEAADEAITDELGDIQGSIAEEEQEEEIQAGDVKDDAQEEVQQQSEDSAGESHTDAQDQDTQNETNRQSE